MKKILFAGVFVMMAATVSAQAPLANSTWKGTMNVPSPAEVSLEFKGDTLNVLMQEQSIETMTYTVSGDTLVITKLYGSSPCSDEKGTYQFSIKEKQLFIKPLSDACELRAAAFPSEAFIKKD